MDIQTIDGQYQQLQSQAQQTTAAIGSLAAKLQDAAKGGNQDAREWLLDLKEIALAMQAEQNQVGLLLQALHAFVVNQPPQVMAPPPGQPGPWGAPPPPPSPAITPRRSRATRRSRAPASRTRASAACWAASSIPISAGRSRWARGSASATIW